MSLGERGRNPFLPRSTAEAASAPYLVRTDGSSLGRPYGFGALLQARVASA
jgi:hypothetical protein